MKNKLLSDFFKGASYNVIGNAFALLCSTIIVLILPKFIGIETYSHYQLYLFYISYVGITNFGLNDGIFLKIGGTYYEKLDKKMIASQFWLLCFVEIIIYLTLLMFVFLNFSSSDKCIIYIYVGLSAMLINPRYYLLYVLLSTAKNKEYTIINVIEKLFTCFFILLCIFCKKGNTEMILLSDILGKVISTGVCIIICKDIVFSKLTKIGITIHEIKINCSIGLKLMCSTLSSMMLIGVIRFGIEKNWDIVTFGKISLLISISNFVLQFINAISNVVFPFLRRLSKEYFCQIYFFLRDFLTYFFLILLCFYQPLIFLLNKWLPQYMDKMIYAVLLFPMCIYECRSSLVCTTFLQTLRKEKKLFYINAFSLLISVVLTIIATKICNDLFFTVLNILIVVGIKFILLDTYMTFYFKKKITSANLVESSLIVLFIVLIWNFDIFGQIIYIFIVCLYLLLNKDKIKHLIYQLKKIKVEE